MRTRVVREGSVGLLILLGLGLVAWLFLWLRGVSFGKRSYTATVEFAEAGGMQKGAVVRYRGVNVGKITSITPRSNGVDVGIEINSPTLLIPRNVLVQANQSGLVGETSIDITPQNPLPLGEVSAKPNDENCDRQLIICNGSRLHGEIGVSLNQLILNSTRLTNLYSNPELFTNVNNLTRNASLAAASVVDLSHQLKSLSVAAQQQLGSLSTTANSIQRTAGQLSATTTQTAAKFGATADQLRLTGAAANRLVSDLDVLLRENRGTLVATLNNLKETSDRLRETTRLATPALNRLTQGKLIRNLETLSDNAAQISESFRKFSNTLNNPTNVVTLQKTLDSARVTFENAQKITSDVDQLTGDPKVRENLKRLINGLSGLVSSTQQLQQQVQLAQTLESTKAAINTSLGNTELAPSNQDTTALANTLVKLQQQMH
ncbi:MAG: MCE family protein [Chroococcidiopsidaceae cyanobacterium CP_BM_ER_R8_30]|nr:MCE family protein [Chroococcidiopsidaceae cyanobacterium CP_BM_ER_R8_30]